VASLVVTIDVEPDLPARREPGPGSLRNIPALRELQRRIPDVKLTLLVTYRVATDPASLRILEQLQRYYPSEIGAHLHPEETPPLVADGRASTSIFQLSPEVRAEKLNTLTRAISANSPRPVSYRAGRWQLSEEDLPLLVRLGYRADTTHTPGVSWRLEHGRDFVDAPIDVNQPGNADIWEVPVSILLNRAAGLGRSRLLRPYMHLSSLELRSLPGPVRAIWNAVRPIRPVWLRPTYSSANEMVNLANRLVERNPSAVLNMMFHSNELTPGGRPFIRTQADADLVLQRAVDACRAILEMPGVSSSTLRDVAMQQPASAPVPVAAFA
jgi:hypothetical protein